MFKIESLRFFNKENEYQEYKFSTQHAFVYGPNTVGKTAFTYLINYALGSSESLFYQGLDNINSVEVHLTNNLTTIWLRRKISGEFYYRRTEDSGFSIISAETYKECICLMLSPNLNTNFTQVYRKVFDEIPTFRSFNFINFLEEKGLGDLSFVFTKAREMKHQIRIQNIMKFFFNYSNIEKIYENKLLLEEREKELNTLTEDYNECERSVRQLRKLFGELNLKYTEDLEKNYTVFSEFKATYARNAKSRSKDIVFLSKASFSLAEEMKLHSFMQSQSENMIGRKERINRLLAILKSVIEESPDYERYVDFIIETVNEIKDEKVILSLTDYNKAVKGIQKEKDKIDQQLKILRSQASEILYEDAVKKIGLIEHIFSILKRNFDVKRLDVLRKETMRLKQEIKELESSFDKKQVNKFSAYLTKLYLESDLTVKHLDEDRQRAGFTIKFDPFRLHLSAYQNSENGLEEYVPGSMARQTHIQILTYMSMFNFLRNNFKNFIYMPLLVLDSANQPMGTEVFQNIYPSIIDLAEEIGVQTIFLSKDLIDGISPDSIIDISNGLNRFHEKSR